MRNLLHAVIAVLLAIALCTAASAQAQGNIIDTLAATGNHTQFLMALNKAGLTDMLRGPGPFTVFAPSDEAFSRLDTCQLNTLLIDCNALRSVLLYHIAYGYLPARDLRLLRTLGTLQGSAIGITTKNGGCVRVNKVQIAPDIVASNGIIHCINCILTPGTPVCPSCDDPIATLTAQAGCDCFSTFIHAMDVAGLNSLLRGSYPITIFAPTDAAFAKLPAGMLDTLMGNPDQLRQLLLYHIAPGIVTVRCLQAGTQFDTFLGVPICPACAGGALNVGGAAIMRQDLRSGCDLIQVIDTVMMPPTQ